MKSPKKVKQAFLQTASGMIDCFPPDTNLHASKQPGIKLELWPEAGLLVSIKDNKGKMQMGFIPSANIKLALLEEEANESSNKTESVKPKSTK